MSEELSNDKPSLASLADGIVQDSQKLLKRRIELVKLEIGNDWNHLKPVLLWSAIGLVATLVAALIGAFAIVSLLDDKTELPLWQCYAFTAAGFLVLVVASFGIAARKRKPLSCLHE